MPRLQRHRALPPVPQRLKELRRRAILEPQARRQLHQHHAQLLPQPRRLRKEAIQRRRRHRQLRLMRHRLRKLHRKPEVLRHRLRPPRPSRRPVRPMEARIDLHAIASPAHTAPDDSPHPPPSPHSAAESPTPPSQSAPSSFDAASSLTEPSVYSSAESTASNKPPRRGVKVLGREPRP